MAWHNVDIGNALRLLADRRIEEAMAEGKFDNLPGQGQPLALEPMPADENARLTWWALRILKRNDVTPHEVRYRKEIDALVDCLATLTDESALPPLVRRVNELVRLVNTLGTNALQTSVVMLDLEAERQRLRARLAGGPRC
jgi:hypothetical protein